MYNMPPPPPAAKNTPSRVKDTGPMHSGMAHCTAFFEPMWQRVKCCCVRDEATRPEPPGVRVTPFAEMHPPVSTDSNSAPVYGSHTLTAVEPHELDRRAPPCMGENVVFVFGLLR